MSMKSLEELHELELTHKFREAVQSLEERLERGLQDKDTILRLAYLYWDSWVGVAMTEGKGDEARFTKRLVELYEEWGTMYGHDPEWQLRFGVMMTMEGYNFGNRDEWLVRGRGLLEQAARHEN